ncbi:MFS transporter [Martelella lutilitoris]|uniref:MFS transporter n=1 Tax=Martelella lutilitoris TaxID=2583532 RepID=A0A5C4JX56_9HYPH|nr:oligopeptide:H+ symporter [Martelella lutilitoris]TNB49249.1 MFS transporter [Martelella lutilitoris]
MPPAPDTKQPRALYVLFMTEFWERFGYYSMVSIFTLYLVNVLKMDDARAFLIFGAYTSFAYLTTVAGGVAADRVLGFGRAIITGAIIVGFGYLTLGFGGEKLMFLALALMAVGNGLFKPNISALLGHFYTDDDPRRAPGFTIFYMGINIGAFAGALLAGIIATKFGYTMAFALAGLGKMASLVTYLAGRRFLEKRDRPPEISGSARWNAIVGLAILLAVGLSAILLSRPEWAGWFVFAVGVALVISYFAIMAREDPESRRRMLILLVLILFSIPFWAIYQQQGISVTLFTDRDINRNVFGWIVPASEGTAFSALVLIILSPFIARLWLFLARKGYAVSDLIKYALGPIFLGLSFWVLSVGIVETGDTVKASLMWIVLFYIVFEIGEICLSPLGLALTTKLAPRRLGGYAMGVWFYATAAANFVAGVIGDYAAVPKGAAPTAEASIYEHGFFVYGLMAIATGIVLLVLAPFLKRMMHNRDDTEAPG